MPITPEIAEKIAEKNLANIIQKVKTGKTLSPAELELVESQKSGAKYADSMKAASAQSGYPMRVLKWAKDRGCPAFRGSRVYIAELEPWINVNKPEIDSGKQLPSKEDVDILLKLEALEERKNKNAQFRKEFLPRAVVEQWLTAKAVRIKEVLILKLKNELPPKLAGLQPDEMAAKMDPVICEIIALFNKPIASNESH